MIAVMPGLAATIFTKSASSVNTTIWLYPLGQKPNDLPIPSPPFLCAGLRRYFALRKLRSKKICPKIFVFDFKYQCHFFRLI